MNNPKHKAIGLIFSGMLFLAFGMGLIGSVIYLLWSVFYG